MTHFSHDARYLFGYFNVKHLKKVITEWECVQNLYCEQIVHGWLLLLILLGLEKYFTMASSVFPVPPVGIHLPCTILPYLYGNFFSSFFFFLIYFWFFNHYGSQADFWSLRLSAMSKTVVLVLRWGLSLSPPPSAPNSLLIFSSHFFSPCVCPFPFFLLLRFGSRVLEKNNCKYSKSQYGYVQYPNH